MKIHYTAMRTASTRYTGQRSFFAGKQNKTLKNAVAFWAFVLLLPLLLSSCVYEQPDPDCLQQLRINFAFDTAMGTIDYTYGQDPEEARRNATTDTRQSAAEGLTGKMTYTIHAYPLADGKIDRNRYDAFTFSRDVEGNYDWQCTLDLDPGQYRVMAWADFDVDGKQYYDTDNFGEVTVEIDPYTGNTDYRDAFMGTLDIDVEESTEGTVKMTRPLAKYEFLATNLEEFLTLQSEINGRDVTLDEYYVVYRYPQFMPSALNMFSGNPNDSHTGMQFSSTLTQFAAGMASFGFDYVFAGEGETNVMVAAAVYSKADGKRVASTPQVNVPLMRSYLTYVKGEFLTVSQNDGVGINPGFDGDIDIPGTLVPSN